MSHVCIDIMQTSYIWKIENQEYKYSPIILNKLVLDFFNSPFSFLLLDI